MKISVIVPAYNAEGSIAECVTALLNQTFSDSEREIIIVDDGSADATGDIIKKYPVTYLRQENKGPAAARNMGAKHATGEIILFTDADCVPNPDWVERMAASFDDPTVMAVKGAYITHQKSFTARFAQAEFEERFEMLRKAESIDMVDTYSAGYRRKVFFEMDGFDESFPVANNEDTDLSYKLSAAGRRMVFNPHAIVRHLNHPASPWRYARLKFFRGYWRMVVYKRYPGKAMKDTYTPQSLKLQIALLFLSAAFLISAAVVIPMAFYAVVVTMFAFLATTVHFAFAAARKDFVIGVLSPFFLALRAGAIGSGVICYLISSKIAASK